MADDSNKEIIVYGAGGHGKVVIDALDKQGRAIRSIVDDDQRLWGSTVLDYPVIGGQEALADNDHKDTRFIIAIGDNALRKKVATWLDSQGFELAVVVHPSAILGRNVKTGGGSFIAAGCVVGPDTSIGKHAIVNTGATLDHDCKIDEFVHVAPGCNLCGSVTVGAGSLIGAGSVVVPGVSIGRNVVIGAGSTVINDISDNKKVAGSPCKPLT